MKEVLYLKMVNEIVCYQYENNEGNILLTLTKQEYKFIQKLIECAFPQFFVNQQNGEEFKLFDVFEVKDNVIAQYELLEDGASY